MTKILVVVGVTVAGFFAPAMYLYQRTYDRSNRIQRELPDAIDLLTISVESGLGFDAALQQVAHNTEGPLADEFSRVLREMQIGSSRSEALRALADRTNLVGAAVVRQLDGPGRRVRHPDRQRAARAVVRDAGEAASAGGGEGPAGAGQDDHPADLLHPARPVHHRDGPGRHPDHGPVRRNRRDDGAVSASVRLPGRHDARLRARRACGGERAGERQHGRPRRARHRLHLAGGDGRRADGRCRPASPSRARPR